jgi:hypothetical protein
MSSISRQVRQLTVRLGEELLNNPRVIALELVNTGNVELKKDDISVSPRVLLSDGRLLSAEAVVRPGGNSVGIPVPTTMLDGRTVEVPAVVLNPDDALVFELFVDGGRQDPTLVMQAAGFTIEEERRPAAVVYREEDSPNKTALYLGLILAVLIGALGTYFASLKGI